MFSASKFEHNYTKSVFKYTEPVSQDYKVFVNGEEIPVYTCRISKDPFNCIWPGHQRPVNQTTPASFVNIVSDEELNIEVVPQIPYKKARIKPYSKNIEIADNDGKLSFTIKNHGQYVLQLGSHHHCLYIFNSALIQAPEKSSVTHYFGPGVHMPGKIVLNDNESIYVDKDALVFGCILAENAKNIHIFGNGLFDDSGEERFNMHCYEAFTNGNAKFYDCENLRIEGVLFKNSAIWCVNLFHCFDVVIDDIKVFGQWRYNTDGIDIMNSQNITIKNSFVHSFDDTIVVKGIDRYMTTDNVNIVTENCVLWCDWGKCCEVGIETACRRYKNIVFRNCDVLRGGSIALDIGNGDCAEISDVVFENINVEYNAFDTPSVYQQNDEMEYNMEHKIHIPYLVRIGNERFRAGDYLDIWGIPADLVGVLDLDGIDVSNVHDVTVKNIKVYYDEDIPKFDGKYNVPIFAESSLEGVEFYNINISDITVNGIEANDETTVNDFRGEGFEPV